MTVYFLFLIKPWVQHEINSYWFIFNTVAWFALLQVVWNNIIWWIFHLFLWTEICCLINYSNLEGIQAYSPGIFRMTLQRICSRWLFLAVQTLNSTYRVNNCTNEYANQGIIYLWRNIFIVSSIWLDGFNVQLISYLSISFLRAA